jgi:hypothetical protein
VATSSAHGVLSFRLRGLVPARIVRAHLRTGSGATHVVALAIVRHGARTGTLRLRVSKKGVVRVRHRSAHRHGHGLRATTSRAGATLIVRSSTLTAPSGLTANAGDQQVGLTWQAASGRRLAGYYVYENGAQVAKLGLTTSYTATGLNDGTPYSFYVVAYNRYGTTSSPSNTVTATPQATSSGGSSGGTSGGSSGGASGLGGSLPAALPQSSGPVVYGSASQSLDSLFSGLSAGSVLCLHSGTYGLGSTAQAQLSASGSASNPITVESCPGETAVIRQLVKVTGSYVRLRNLVIDRNAYPTDSRYGQGGSSPGGNVGIWLTGSHVTLEHSEIRNNAMSGVFGGGPYDQVIDNYIHDNGTTPDDHGMYWTSSNSLIANNLVTGNYDMGVQLGYSSTSGNVIANNTSARNGLVDPTHPGSGFVTFSGTANNLFVNNISYANGEFGFKTYDTANTLSHNASYANPAGDTYGSFAANSSLLHADPLFVSSTNYGLQSGSPARGYGDSAYTPSTDYAGNGRPGADLGALN